MKNLIFWELSMQSILDWCTGWSLCETTEKVECVDWQLEERAMFVECEAKAEHMSNIMWLQELEPSEKFISALSSSRRGLMGYWCSNIPVQNYELTANEK